MDQPFEPAVQSGAVGDSQTIALGAGSATSQNIVIPASVGNGNTSLLVTMLNNNATGNLVAYMRLSVESSTVNVATATDTALVASPQTPSVSLFASPNPAGRYTISVIVTATPTTAGQIWFSPGTAGV